jgi:hypothetical protein
MANESAKALAGALNLLFPPEQSAERYQVRSRFDWQGEYFEVVDAHERERTVHQFRTRQRANNVAEMFNLEYQARRRE